LYVGITRARDFLFLSHAGKRILYGRELRLKPSRFLSSLPRALLSHSTLVARFTRKEEQLTLPG
jgi:superfamily I DNA/RNA helicase